MRRLVLRTRRRRPRRAIWIALTVFALVVVVFPKMVDEAHFFVARALRRHPHANRDVNAALHVAFDAVDSSVAPRLRSLHVSPTKTALENSQACVDALPSSSFSYHLTLKDSWKVFAALLILNDRKTLDLKSATFRNVLTWRGLSGSDDLLWAVVALLSNDFELSSRYTVVTGSRGPLELYEEVQNRYLANKRLAWDSNASYEATVSLSLYAAASSLLRARTGQAKYCDNVLKAASSLLDGESPLISQTGDVCDGREYSKDHERGPCLKRHWTYNAGLVVRAMNSAGETCNCERCSAVAKKVALRSLQTFFDPQTGLLRESVEARHFRNNNDVPLFKGVYLNSIAEFVKSLDKKDDSYQKIKAKALGLANALAIKFSGSQRLCPWWGEALECYDDRHDALALLSLKAAFDLAHSFEETP